MLRPVLVLTHFLEYHMSYFQREQILSTEAHVLCRNIPTGIHAGGSRIEPCFVCGCLWSCFKRWNL
jgi:hypothetical protein